MLDFQERMAIGRASHKREIERSGGSTVRIYETAEQRYAGHDPDDWSFGLEDDVADEVDASPAGERTELETEEIETSTGRPQITLSGKMTAKQYVKFLKQLGLTPYSAPAALGISVRTSFGYAAGTRVIPTTVAKLLRALAELGRAEV